jgi:ApaG protein
MQNSVDASPEIEIRIQTQYLKKDSLPQEARFVFSYTITITNHGQLPVQLINRHWHICDANEKTQEVHGKGVIGQQPYLKAGQSFEYTSGAVLETPVGTMEGSYEFITDNGELFMAPIPAFTLADPATLH